MSRFQSTRRRLSLLAGSSLVAASLTAAMSFGVALMPTVALAANECAPVGVDPAVNLQAPDSYNCDQFSYPAGVTYDSAGDLTVVTDPGVDPNWGIPHTDLAGEGITLTGHDDDTVTFDALSSYIFANEATGAGLTVTTVSGDISITSLNTLSSVGSHGILAGSDSGDVDIAANFASGMIGIEASSVSGNVSYNGFGITGSGGQGILATSGTGDVSISGSSINGTGAQGVLATSTTGDVSIDLQGVSGSTGIEATAGGNVTITGSSISGTEGYGILAASTGGGLVDVTVSSVDGATTGISATSTGDVNVTATSTQGGAEAGIQAISTGGGDVHVTAGSTNGPLVGIQAISTGGDGDVLIDASQTISSTLGIYAETSGSGALTLNLQGETSGESGIGVDVVTETGLLTINLGNLNTTNSSAIFGAQGAIRTDTGGDAVINLLGNAFLLTGPGGNPSLDLGIGAGTTTTINLTRAPNGSRPSFNEIVAAGGGALAINNGGSVQGGFDLSGLAGGLIMNTSSEGIWRLPNFDPNAGMAESVILSPGSDTITSSGRVLAGIRTAPGNLPPTASPLALPTIVDFGGGEDSFANDGLLVLHFGPGAIDPRSARNFKAETRFENLETFTHSGLILLGGRGDSFDLDGTGDLTSDGWYDDALIMDGATWVGEGGEVVFDVNLNTENVQTNCTDRDTVLGDRETGNLMAGDCISLVGGATEGVTYATIVDAVPGDRGVYIPEGIVLVDVSGDGAGGHQGDFVLSDKSSSYSDMAGGVIDKGLFFYTIAYDEEDKQHKLFGLPGPNALQFPLLATAAQSLWRVSTGAWSDRQADLRGSELDNGYGMWLRTSGEFANRDMVQAVDAIGNTYLFDNTYEQTSYAITGGLDLLTGGEGDTTYVVGLMAGYAHTQLEYEESPNTASMDGWTGGVYASFLSGPLFVDAAINANKLILKEDVPGLGLLPEGTILDTNLLSVGGVVEAGWRWAFANGAFVEPLAAVSYVRTKYDDLKISQSDPLRPASTVEFDDPTSLRASIGARLGLDANYGSMRAQYFMLGRLWNEFEGENGVILHNAGPDAIAVDDFSGQFTEFGMGASLYSPDGAVSGFLNVGGKFAEEYKAVNGTAGVRVNW